MSIIYQLDIPNKKVVNEFKTPEDITKLYPDFKWTTIQPCIRGARKTAYKYTWIQGEPDMNFDEYFIVSRPNNLFVDLYPELVKEWNYEKNVGIDINTITYGSETKVWWLCPKDHETYLSSMNNRTSMAKVKGCPICGVDSLRVHDKDEKEEHLKNYKPGISTTLVGDSTEEYIAKLLESSGKFTKVEGMGYKGDRTDTIITLNSGIMKSVQVKTLTKSKVAGKYRCAVGFEYDENLLIVMADKERKYFSAEFAGKIRVDKLSLYFEAKMKTKYHDIMYQDEKIFLQKLIELIPESVDYTGFNSSPTIMKEDESFIRLDKWCVDNKLVYDRNLTNSNSIDLFINKIPLQGKYRASLTSSFSVAVGFTKNGRRLNGKTTKIPYSVDEDKFEFFVAEIGGTKKEPTKYCGNFLFIPRKDLIEMNFFRSSTSKGKSSFTICAPDYTGDHWSKKYWLPLIITDQQRNLFS